MRWKFLAIICLLFPTLSFADVEIKEFSAAGLQAVKVSNISGDVTIFTTSGNKASVTVRKLYFSENCSLAMEKSGDVLSIMTLETSGNGGSCRVHYDIRVHRDVSLDIKNGSGDVEVIGTRGDIRFNLGSGNIRINAVVSNLEGVSGSGNIDASGLTGDAILKVGSGNIKLSYSSSPKRGELTVLTGSGDTNIYMPAATRIVSDMTTGSGLISSEIESSSDAQFRVMLKSGSGNLSINKTP